MQVQNYLDEIRALPASGKATEHSYRPALERLFKSIDGNLVVITESQQSVVGAPDFPVAFKGVSVSKTDGITE